MSGSFYAPPENRHGDTIELSTEEAHHAISVLRLRPGEEAVVVDGEGGWYRVAAPQRASREGRLSLAILEERREVGEPFWHLTLAQAVGKSRKFELVVEKGTELGVSAFIPLSTDREIVMLSSTGLTRRRERWQRIALSAMKQCGRSRLPLVDAPLDVRSLSARQFAFYDAVLVAWEREKRRTVADALRGRGWDSGMRPKILALVGSEGGFTEKEVAAAVEAGAALVTLGPRILRMETAGIVIAAHVGAALEERANA